jgi:hypothetical protein
VVGKGRAGVRCSGAGAVRRGIVGCGGEVESRRVARGTRRARGRLFLLLARERKENWYD